MKDFTLEKYGLLCETISKSSYTTVTFEQYFSLSQKNLSKNCLLLRHDVDRNIGNALKMADIEHKFNIVSTYYCRKTERVFRPECFKKIASMGHEIGYHYETLDKAKGNEVEAIKIFEQELKTLREYINIKTACMHGNPLTPWLNSNIWKNYNFKEFGILGEPYLSLDYKSVVYLTDTGRTWANENVNVKDFIRNENFKANNFLSGNISTTDDVINLIKQERLPQICLLAHPHSWHDYIIEWIRELISQKIKNIGKAGIVWYWKRRTQL
ncbi:MAG: hypothetical protein WA130_20630 [Candidatus Methanoperedens sp.]